MSGRITFRHGQPREAFVRQVAPLSPPTLAALESALGRTLTDPERARIAETIEAAQFWRERAAVRASAEDCRATLAALARESDGTVLAAFAACDVTTRAHLWAALSARHLGPSVAELQPTPATLRKAAEVALDHLHDKRGPRCTHLRLLAGNAASLWRALGGASCSAAARGNYATPLVRFAAVLFEASGNSRGLSAVAKLLRDEMRSGEITDTN